jgi:putative transposase
LSLRKQCELLGINRSSLYYEAVEMDIDDVGLLNEIRDIWERRPFYGYRRITKELQSQGYRVNHKRVQRLMVSGGIEAIYPGPNTSRRNKLHAVHAYLLKDLAVVRANQAWMVDITYLRLDQGFVYLVALIDVYSRYVVGWALSTSLDTEFCVDALKSALIVAQPELINSDQGCQFTSEEWIGFLKAQTIQVSMTGKGRCLGRVENWRGYRRFRNMLLPVAFALHRCLKCLSLNSVSSPRSSNRTCATNASGFRTKYHAFALDTSALTKGIL